MTHSRLLYSVLFAQCGEGVRQCCLALVLDLSHRGGEIAAVSGRGQIRGAEIVQAEEIRHFVPTVREDHLEHIPAFLIADRLAVQLHVIVRLPHGPERFRAQIVQYHRRSVESFGTGRHRDHEHLRASCHKRRVVRALRVFRHGQDPEIVVHATQDLGMPQHLAEEEGIARGEMVDDRGIDHRRRLPLSALCRTR